MVHSNEGGDGVIPDGAFRTREAAFARRKLLQLRTRAVVVHVTRRKKVESADAVRARLGWAPLTDEQRDENLMEILT